MSELSPAARAVLEAAAVNACLAEWGPVNDPPCHPDDEGWNGCHLCVKRDLIAAALQAAVNQVLPENVNPVGDLHDDARHEQWMRIRYKFLALAAEMEGKND